MKSILIGLILGTILGGAVFWYIRQANVVQVGISKYSNAVIEEVTFYALKCNDACERIARHGILYRNSKAKATVVVCHGFMCDKSDIRCLRHMFKDYNVFFFDFRAHGEDTHGQLCTFGCDEVHDIHAAVDYIRSHKDLKGKPVIVYSFSMGSVSSIHAQARYGNLFDCAIWDCPFDSTDRLITRLLGDMQFSLFGYSFAVPGQAFLRKHVYNPQLQMFIKAMLRAIKHSEDTPIPIQMVPVDTVEFAKNIKIPSFFITCVNDKKAPPSAVQRVYDAAQGYKRYWITAGRRHFDSYFYNPEKYEYRVHKFIDEFLDNTYKKKQAEKVYRDIPVTEEEAEVKSI